MRKRFSIVMSVCLLLAIQLPAFSQKKIVIVGSSTAAGTGATAYDSSWTGRLQKEFRKNTGSTDPDTVVTNISIGGLVSYQAMPTGYIPPAGRPLPDPEHNVTKALSFLPDIVIVNLPSNDIGNGYSKTEFMNNLRFIRQAIESAGVKVYTTTTQPRTQYVFSLRQMLRELVDSVTNTFGATAINFWDDLATTDDQYLLKNEVNSGDGIHVNNLGHRLLFERVKAKNIFGTVKLPVTTRIEAENWTAMNGVRTESAWGDPQGGGLIVGWIEQGDWMDYSYNAPATGTYSIKMRVASPLTGAQLQIRNSSGTVLQTVSLPNTGGWQTWTTITTNINLTAGTQTLRLYASNATGWNINWWELTPVGVAANQPPTVNAGNNQTITLPTSSVSLSGSATDPDGTISTYLWSKQSGPAAGTITTPSAASTTVTGLVQGTYVFRLTATDNGGAIGFGDITVMTNAAPAAGGSTTRIEAENWTAMNGVRTENAWGDPQGGGLIVGWIEQGDWMDYSYNAPATGTYSIKMRVASPLTGAQLQIRNSAGTVLGTVSLPNTGGWQTWQTITTSVNLTAGTQTLRLYASNATGWNINWWELTSPAGTLLSAASPTEGIMTAEQGPASAPSIDIFPNPVNDRFALQVNNALTGSLKVEVLNTGGAVQKQFALQKTVASPSQFYLSIGELPAASYFIKVTMEGWTQSKQISKQ